MTMNQVVGYNLARARRLREWTQKQACEALAKHGRDWSTTVYSNAERAAGEGRTRVFDADDLLVFSLAFNLSITFFLLPPGPDDEGRVPFVVAHESNVKQPVGDPDRLASDYLRQLLEVNAYSWSDDLAARFRNATPIERATLGGELRQWLASMAMALGSPNSLAAGSNFAEHLHKMSEAWMVMELNHLQMQVEELERQKEQIELEEQTERRKDGK